MFNSVARSSPLPIVSGIVLQDSLAMTGHMFVISLQETASDIADSRTHATPPHTPAAAAVEPRWKGALPSMAPVGVWGRSPDLGVGWKCVSDASAVTEVHLRRLDAAAQLHRRVVAVLTVDATPAEVCTRMLCTCVL